ncbi:MAG: hypothetical protein ACOC2L_04445, partial [Candidatus Sumerlaeota bacterium]
MFDWIFALSPTLRLAGVLFVIVVLMRLKLHMGWALAAGAVTLKFLFPMTIDEFFSAAAKGIVNFETLYLLAIVSGLLAFSAA